MEAKQTFTIFDQLFGKDIASMIVSYSETNIILLQDYCPKLLENIVITHHNMYLINENDYKYITKILINDDDDDLNATIVRMSNLLELECANCSNYREHCG